MICWKNLLGIGAARGRVGYRNGYSRNRTSTASKVLLLVGANSEANDVQRMICSLTLGC